MARLYSNENFPIPVVKALRLLGHDVLTVQEAGKAEQAISDPEVLEFATSENRAVLTINRRDFIRLHREFPRHGGIIVRTIDFEFESQAGRIDAAVTEHSSLAGLLIRVNRPA